ncbi:translation elongation factor Ts [Ureaplasma canigenitalium]|uniref:translation elongation factor Ts n=1 Tax=Ureaplasma canigenitalium TaxID=42092 RepID=UPI0004E0B001|nr:translation elongation factor Ts [Ureaplasma canigenitalium]
MTRADLVKELRKRTQAGMMDCMKALDHSNNDIEGAIVYLRENGAIKAANKQMNVATDGVVLTKQEGNKAVMIEVNCQTDFVAKTDEFLAYANNILDISIKEVNNDEDFGKLIINGKKIEDSGLDLTATIGEKIVFRRGKVLKANENQTLGSYTHNNKRVGAIVLIDNQVEMQVAKDVAMHAAAMRPSFLDENNVDQEWLSKEKAIITESLKNEGKDMKFADKIIQGRLNKALAENCLVNQAFFKIPSMTISSYLLQNGGKAVDFAAFEVGEGIEKKPELSFAEEVANQMKK